MRTALFPLAGTLLLALGASAAKANIVVPTLAASSNLNPFDVGTPGKLTDNSGLTAPVNGGATLASILGVRHVFDGGYAQSWVTNASTSDYFTGFGAANPPIFVWDLGQNLEIDHLVLWQYQNNGGSNTNVGNHARTIALRFNTEADGFASFLGPATNLAILPVVDNDGVPGDDLGGVNSVQPLDLSAYGRYVQMTVTDNYRGFQGITGGGDRVGLGELRFDAQAVPEPATCALLGLGLMAAAARCRSRRTRGHAR